MQATNANGLLAVREVYRRRLGEDSPVFQRIDKEVTRRFSRLDPFDEAYDPVDVVMQNEYFDNEYKTARKNYVEQRSEESAQKLSSAISQSFLAQRQLGVPVGAERLISKVEARGHLSQLMHGSNPAESWKLISSLYPPEYHRQLAFEIASADKSAPPSLRIALMSPENVALWKAQKVDVKNPQFSKVLKDIRDQINRDSTVNTFLEITGDSSLREGLEQAALFF
jgi:hypothetical protein